jgi:hypothetical protein
LGELSPRRTSFLDESLVFALSGQRLLMMWTHFDVIYSSTHSLTPPPPRTPFSFFEQKIVEINSSIKNNSSTITQCCLLLKFAKPTIWDSVIDEERERRKQKRVFLSRDRKKSYGAE